MAAVSFDSVETLKHFSKRIGITYPLLSDQGSKVIRAFGILNDQIPSDRVPGTGIRQPYYGVPHPGSYLIDPQGIIQSKYFLRKFYERFMSAGILVREFGHETDSPHYEVKSDHFKITASASNAVVSHGYRVELALDVKLNPGIHVYAPSVEGEYTPIQWKMMTSPAWLTHAVDYPPSRKLHLPAIDETVPVYEGSIRMKRGLTIGHWREFLRLGAINAEQELVIEGSFQYQACDDQMCYFPVDVPLKWTFKVQGRDMVLVPGSPAIFTQDEIDALAHLRNPIQ